MGVPPVKSPARCACHLKLILTSLDFARSAGVSCPRDRMSQGLILPFLCGCQIFAGGVKSRTVKAWILEQPAPAESRPLVLTDVPVPQPADDEVLVKVHACGICRTDLHVVEGELPIRRSSVIPGHQVVGTISAVGSRVDGFKPGDRVGIAWLNQTCGICE